MKIVSFSSQVDIYSLGLILFELLVPFSTQMERMQTMSEARKLRFPDHFVANMSDEHALVCTMLSPVPSQRPETSDILEMDFLREMVVSDVATAAVGRKRLRSSQASGGSGAAAEAASSANLFVDPTNDYLEDS